MSTDLSEKVAFKAPPLSCDSHFHVFGPAEKYPYGADLRYKPPVAVVEDYLPFARHLGIERYVFVQPSAYGRDNACMLDAMRVVGPEKCRGIVDIDESIPDRELADLHAIGVRGVRINVSPVKPLQPGFSATMIPRIQKLDARCAELGWCLDFLGPGWLTGELMDTFRGLKSQYSLAHIGMYLARDGVSQQGFQDLLDLVKNGNGRCWIKFTGTYRVSQAEGFADVAPLARAVVAAAPNRIIWGSDWPHLSFEHVSSVQLFNLLADWADEKARKAILVDNPKELFGF